MADIVNATSTYSSGTIDTASTLVDNVSPHAAKHVNYPVGAIIQLETILGAGTTLKGTAADLATRLAIPLETSGKLKDFSAANKTTFPVSVAEGGSGAATFTDGAVLVGNGTSAVQAVALPSKTKALIHSGTAATDPIWGSGLCYQGPSSIGSGSTRSLETFTSATGNLNGIHFYDGDFTLNNGHTLTVQAGYRRVAIIATGTITINGTITATGAGGAGGAIDTMGDPGTDQPGGGAGYSGGAQSYAGGNILCHGCVVSAGGAGSGSGAGTAGTQITGSSIMLLGNPLTSLGGSGGGGNADTAGAAGGGSIILIAPIIVLGNTAVLQTKGNNGTATFTAGSGGGGAGNVYIITRSYTDNGCTFTLTGGTGGAGSLYAGGAGATGVKQINIYA